MYDIFYHIIKLIKYLNPIAFQCHGSIVIIFITNTPFIQSYFLTMFKVIHILEIISLINFKFLCLKCILLNLK